MSQPNTCLPTYHYFQDLAAGPGVDPSWTIDQYLGSPAVEQASGHYQVTAAASGPSASEYFIHQVLGGVPTAIQMDVGWGFSYLDASFSGVSTYANINLQYVGIPGPSRVEVGSEYISGYPDPTTHVQVIIYDFLGNLEYTYVIHSFHDTSLPASHSGTETIKVVQVGGDNIEVYVNGVLIYTSVSHGNTMYAAVGIGVRAVIGAHTTSYANVSNISYVGPTGLPSLCVFAPAAPTLSSPANSATGVSLTPTLVWNAASGADTYHLQTSALVDFSVLHDDVSGIGATSYAITPLTASTIYYWRVLAHNTAGDSAWSTVWSFTSLASLPPTLLSPANAATGVSLTPTLTVTDNNSPPSDSFDFQIATDSGFSSIVYQATAVANSPSVTFGDLVENTLYYWRARAKVGAIYSAYSSTFTFTTAVFHLVSPDEAAENIPLQPMLVTSGLVGASAYNIQLSQFSDMHSPDYDITVNDPSVAYHIPSNLRPFTIYYWRARPIVDDVPLDWTGIRYFVTAPIPAVVLAPQNPEVMMRYSIDRGKTWSDEDWQEVGGNGSYEGRNRWVGLGSGYGIAFWFRTVSDRYVSWRGGRFRAQ